MIRKAANEPVGTLTGEQIKAAKLIQGGDDACFRAMSYDLRVGTIIDPRGECQTTYKIPAQGIVEVIAAENVALPLDVAGHVSVKTSLCNEGLLALNIGIVDPGYSGKISSFLVNFGKDEQLLAEGDVFLRATFQKLNSQSRIAEEHPTSDDEYIRSRQKQVVAGFGRTFLNTEEVINSFLDDTLKKFRTAILGYVGIAALGLALLTFLLNFGTFAAIQRWVDPRVIMGEQAEARQNLLLNENRELSERVQRLEVELNSLKRSAAVPAAPSQRGPGT